MSSRRVSAPVMKTMCRASLVNSVGPVVSYQVYAVAPLSAPYCSVDVSNDSLSAAIDVSLSRRKATDLTAALGPSYCTVNWLSPRVKSWPTWSSPARESIGPLCPSSRSRMPGATFDSQVATARRAKPSGARSDTRGA